MRPKKYWTANVTVQDVTVQRVQDYVDGDIIHKNEPLLTVQNREGIHFWTVKKVQ
jgi:hypothetical protein